jgi:hypothetical protein
VGAPISVRLKFGDRTKASGDALLRKEREFNEPKVFGTKLDLEQQQAKSKTTNNGLACDL